MCFPQGPLTKMKKVSGQSSLTSNKQNFGWLLRLRIRVFALPSECLSCHIRIAHLLWYSKADSHTAINCMPTEVPCLAASVRRRVPPDQVSACRLSDPSFASRLYQLELSVLNLFPYCKPFLLFHTISSWCQNYFRIYLYHPDIFIRFSFSPYFSLLMICHKNMVALFPERCYNCT